MGRLLDLAAEGLETAGHGFLPLTPDERQALERLADAWQMDASDREVMFRQCTQETILADVDRTPLSPAEARRFWLREAANLTTKDHQDEAPA